VAVDAGGRPVCPQQGELGLGVVESREFLPGFGCMAGLATQRTSVSTDLLHTLVELSLVYIVMTTGAGEVLPVIDHVWLRLKLGRLLVAVGARYGDMSAGQYKVRLLVLRKGEGRRLVSLQVVAAIARVEIGRRCKLSRMPVFMAVRAQIKLYPVQRVFALGHMALSALKSSVPALKRILGRGVLLNSEKRRLPALYVVTRRTLAAIRALRELSLVSIFVTVRALLEGDGLLEIPIRVALFAFDRGVFAFQRILCLRVVKLFVDALKRDLFPSTGCVA